ncbi:MAG: tetratricopeptide repeat protein [Fibrobacter sp.]|nr:tetratricopeptide repeat protein [Fibrobacter sp.]
MVKVLLTFALAIALNAWGNYSGLYSHKAQQSFYNGNYNSAHHDLKKALRYSKKEANTDAEANIYVALSEIYLQQHNFAKAEKTLEKVKLNEVSDHTKLSFVYTSLRLYNQQQKFSEAQKFVQNFQHIINDKKLSSSLRAFCLLEQGVINAAQKKDYETPIKAAQKTLKKKSAGQIAWTQAKISHLNNDLSSALELYQEAFKHAQNHSKYWETAEILVHISRVYEQQNQNTLAAQNLFRAIQVYEQLDLSKAFLLNAEKWKELTGKNDLDYKIQVKRKRMESP